MQIMADNIFDCDIIGFLLHPNRMVPADAQERLAVAVQLYEAFLCGTLWDILKHSNNSILCG